MILLVGTNLRWEAPLINTRVRKAVYKKGAKVFGIGPEIDLTYKVEWLGNDASLVAKLPKAALDALKAPSGRCSYSAAARCRCPASTAPASHSPGA